MSPLTHATFTIERRFPAAPRRVFAAWADPEAKARWFAGPPGTTELERRADFRVGGQEILHGKHPSGFTSLYSARYHVIERDQRIVYVYDMLVDEKLLSVSLATVQFRPDGTGTHLVYTEQAAYFADEQAARSREQGSAVLLDRLVEVVGAG